MALHQPIGIFDAGIGSYAIVERVRKRFHDQDIVYLADRASFPYGAKTPEALLASVARATHYLVDVGCKAVVLASNAPSIVVLDRLLTVASVPVIGVFPPVREALARSSSGQVAVLGVRSMVTSEAMRAYAHQHAGGGQVELVNASALVDLVESFTFLNDPETTQEQVTRFITELRAAHPAIDVMTMSSTHLPWLRPFFETAAPDVCFLDPADRVLDELLPFVSEGSAQTHCVATETTSLTIAHFNAALRTLGTGLTAQLLSLGQPPM